MITTIVFVKLSTTNPKRQNSRNQERVFRILSLFLLINCDGYLLFYFFTTQILN